MPNFRFVSGVLRTIWWHKLL